MSEYIGKADVEHVDERAWDAIKIRDQAKRITELTAEVERLKKENEIKLDKWLDHGSDMMEELERLRPENKRLQSKLAKATAALKTISLMINPSTSIELAREIARDTLAEIEK